VKLQFKISDVIVIFDFVCRVVELPNGLRLDFQYLIQKLVPIVCRVARSLILKNIPLLGTIGKL
jgi:hypothetical protein